MRTRVLSEPSPGPRGSFTSTGVVYGVDDPAVADVPWLGVSA
jgi:hypothetical protein